MTNIIFIVYVVIFVCVLFVLLLASEDKKENKIITTVLGISMILIYFNAFYRDHLSLKSDYWDFYNEYTVAKTIIEAEIQNKTIFADNEQLINKAIEYNIKLASIQSKAQKQIIGAIPKEIMDLEPIQIHEDYDIKWIIG